ncbi:MAG TPA: acylphosphatase [Thiobacillaceae bacterium]|nr:acylphosphatase [Thiobacillaceae bacterium]HNU63200.1 acylphosphatase [Thiobacillaceae bacterium]
MLTRHLRITGRVQGVWYRESMRREAERLQVNGWVRNTLDGAVEAVIQGEEAAVEALIAWAREGPPAARVEGVNVSPASGRFQGFERLPTTRGDTG